MAIQPWETPKTDFIIDSLHTVDDMNRVENNLLHLKQKPHDDFDLMGRKGQGWYTSAATEVLFWVVKRIPPRTSLYIRESMKCFPNSGGEDQYFALQLDVPAYVTYPLNNHLTWHTAPDTNPLIRWISTKTVRKRIEHYTYDDVGLKLMTNPLYVSAYIQFIARSYCFNTTDHAPEDTIYMRFHIGYNDI